MKRLILTILGIFLILFTVNLTPVTDPSPLGSWVFNVDQAPWEYSRGTIIFEENEDYELSGVVHFHTGQQLSILKISIDGNEMVFDANVDGYEVQSVVTISDDELTGYVVTIDGNMHFKAIKEVETKD
jgi:hypothetical protein